MLESKSSHESLNLAHDSDSSPSPSPGLEYYNTGIYPILSVSSLVDASCLSGALLLI